MYCYCEQTPRTIINGWLEPLLQAIWQFVLKLNIYISYYPVILHLDVYLRDMKIFPQKTHIKIFLATFFIIAPNLRKKWLYMKGRIKRLLEVFSYNKILLINKEKLLSDTQTTWMNLKKHYVEWKKSDTKNTS